MGTHTRCSPIAATSLVAAAFCLTSCDLPAEGDGTCYPVYEPGSNPLGKPYEHWAAEWHQWVYHTPFDNQDNFGCNCDTNQSGEVFFLGPHWGQAEVRECTVSSLQSLLLTTAAAAWIPCPEITDESECVTTPEALHELATAAAYDEQERIQEVTIDDCVLDTAVIAPYFVITGAWEVFPPVIGHCEYYETDPYFSCCDAWDGDHCGMPTGEHKLAISYGYWLMVEPLEPGEHTIGIAVESPAGVPSDVTYELTVE
jgi:hypothetical protein